MTFKCNNLNLKLVNCVVKERLSSKIIVWRNAKKGEQLMARHGEKIRKRKDGRWEGRYKIGNNEKGKTTYKSVYGKTYFEVKEKLKDVENNILLNSAAKQTRQSFSYALQIWFASVKINLKKATVHKYEYLIEKHILPELGSIQLSKIDANIINTFADRKLTNGSLDGKRGLSKSYVRTMLLIISAALEHAAQEGWCKEISSKITKPKPEKNELRILNVSEQQHLEKVLISNLSITALGILITLQTGLRIGEICALTWEDFDLVNNILYVRSTISRIRNPLGKGTTLIVDTPKTASSIRAIPFSNELRNILVSIKKQSVSSFVVSDKPGFISPRTFEYRYHKLMKIEQLPDLNYHALRHTFATRCIECGVDVKSLSEILGHSNVSITLNTYVHSSMNLKRAQLDKLPTLSA